MTRQLTASAFKGRGRVLAPRPREGTAIRALYDALRSGQLVNINKMVGRSSRRTLVDLKDYYGMETEAVPGLHGGVRLLGEWEGDVFVPIERIVQDYAE